MEVPLSAWRSEFRPLPRSTPLVEDRRSRHSTLVFECRRYQGRRHYHTVLGGIVPALINPLMSRGIPFLGVVEGDIRHLLFVVDE